MPNSFDLLSDLAAAASRARQVAEDIVGVTVRAEALEAETNWQARAAHAFREAVRVWSAELAGIRAQLDDLADETTSAAARERWRLEIVPVGAAR